MPLMTLRIAFAALLVLTSFSAAQADTHSAEIWHNPTCGCCIDWVDHLEENGFTPSINSSTPGELAAVKQKLGIPDKLASCHTAEIGGYAVEGHVPASDIKRLLEEQPDAVGLAVPGMPIGSPGMEYGDVKEPYDVLLVKKDGSTEVFASH
jgi:hypothetical protein